MFPAPHGRGATPFQQCWWSTPEVVYGETALRCTAARANADVDGDDVTECTGHVQTEPLRTTRGSTCRIWTERRAVWQRRHQ